jgi:hypothetical protein
MMADIIGIRVDTLPVEGGEVHGPVAAIVLASRRTWSSALSTGLRG